MVIFTFSFWTENTFFRQIYSKRIKLFKIKFDAQTNSNMMNLIVMLNFGLKILLGENLAQKCKFPVKNQIQYRSMLNSTVIFTYFGPEVRFWVSLVQKVRIIYALP